MSVSKEKLFGLLTICRKAGRMTMGFDSVKESILTDKAKAVFLASDISAKTEKEVRFFADQKAVPVCFGLIFNLRLLDTSSYKLVSLSAYADTCCTTRWL